MSLVLITGKKDGIFQRTGVASVYLDGVHGYEGRRISGDYAFEVMALGGGVIVQSSPEPSSRWRAFLGHGSHSIRAADGQEVARITYSGVFGFERLVAINGRVSACPRRREIAFPGARVALDAGQRDVHVEVLEEAQFLPYLGVAFYLWLRLDTDSA